MPTLTLTLTLIEHLLARQPARVRGLAVPVLELGHQVRAPALGIGLEAPTALELGLRGGQLYVRRAQLALRP